MNNVFKKKGWYILPAFVVLTILSISWQNDDTTKQGNAKGQHRKDTSPPLRLNPVDTLPAIDLDNAMQQLNVQMKNLDIQLKNIDVQINQQVKDAMKQVDLEKIQEQVNEQIKNIDFEKIQEQVNLAMKEVQEQMKHINLDSLHVITEAALKNAQLQLKAIDMDAIKKELDNVKVNIDEEAIEKEVNSAMSNAKTQLEQAKKQLQELRSFIDELDKDGLIDKNKSYTIEWKNGGDLYINGVEQSKETSAKYKKYYKQDGIKISTGNNGNMSINSDNE